MAQILRLANGAAFAGGLNPAQWSALRYLADAVPEARTVTAFAQYHATTSGTASQTVAALVRKELVERLPELGDRRRNRLELTSAGHRLLQGDPLGGIAAAIAAQPPEVQDALITGLQATLRTLMQPEG
ncbi:transcriptional regulator [Paramagnetospirillum caucaseum]|uniref:Transcriptional regulator n=1 Tax=Paramagnetospirillum caucaseum TaxID=1244869 RepID=M2ZNA5_9PROT|nr:MarR family transcriptional regulator [Paramagnetospirillum caucaseum]EME68777.1 transcriptional regulator [Paramagnetospirillum caucaseum]